MAALALTLTDGNSANDLNLLDSDNITVVEGGIEVLELPTENNRLSLVLKLTGASAATMLLNQNKLLRMGRKAFERAKGQKNPIVEINYTPDGGTQVKKYVYDGKLTTSPWAGATMSKESAGRRTLMNVRLDLTVEPYWRGISEITLGPNICDNSDFEWNPTAALGTTAPTGWTKTGGANWQGQITVTNRKYGRKCFRYTPSASAADDEGIYQDITVVSGQTYMVSVYVTPVAGTAQIILSNGAGGNLVTADSSGTASQKLTPAAWVAAGTTLRIGLVQSGTGIPDFYWDSVLCVNATSLPVGYIAGYTFDNQDVTLLDRNGEVIVAELPGDVPPYMRLAIENPSANAYTACSIGRRAYYSSDEIDIRHGQDTQAAGGVATNVSPSAGSLGNDHVSYVTTATYAQFASLTIALATITQESPSAYPRRYNVYLRLSTNANGPLSIQIRNIAGLDDILAEQIGMGSTGGELRWRYLGTIEYPLRSRPNQTNTGILDGLALWAKRGATATTLTCDVCLVFPADSMMVILKEVPGTGANWYTGQAKYLIAENISNPGSWRVGNVSSLTTPERQAAYRAYGDPPSLEPNLENRLTINVTRNETLARLDEQFRAILLYTPRWITPRGD